MTLEGDYDPVKRTLEGKWRKGGDSGYCRFDQVPTKLQYDIEYKDENDESTGKVS